MSLYIAAMDWAAITSFVRRLIQFAPGRLEIDVLMLVVAGGAAALDELAKGALLLLLFSVDPGA